MGYIVIDFERCKACYFCVETCPKELIKIGKKTNLRGYRPPKQKPGDECKGCCLCAEVCPDTAIEVYR